MHYPTPAAAAKPLANRIPAAALDYASRGWAVFPCTTRGKTPSTQHGARDATRDPAVISRLFDAADNIGLATGAVSGVWVLDCDGDQGLADLASLEAEHGALPATLSQSTGGGGRHFLFRLNGVPIRNRQRIAGLSLDVRGDGGYVIAAPSIHPTGVPYRWDSDPGSTPIAEAPAWLVDIVTPKSKPVLAVPAAPTDSRLAVMDRARKYIAMMPPAIAGQGGHAATYAVACRLCRDFALDDEDALALLLEYNQRCEPAWDEKELAHKIESAMAATAGEPRGTLLAAERLVDDPPVDISAIMAAATQAPEAAPMPACGPVLTCMADIEARSVRWLWPGRVPLGRLTLLVGVPGAGKSYLTLDMASRVSTGTPWPDDSPCERGSVVIVSAEDDPHDTIRPRLDAAGADVTRVHLLSGVLLPAAKKGADPVEVMFTLADVGALDVALSRIGDVRLVIVDPIGSYLGGRTDAHRDNEVRGVLAPIAAMAEKHGAAVVIVAHRRKTSGGLADDTALGSRGFTGIARAVWHVSKDPEEKNRRLLLPGKCNLSRQNTGLAFGIVGEPARIAWARGPVDMTADEGLAAEMAARERPRGPAPEATDGAETWLRAALADGPRAAKDLCDEWRNGQGGSKRTLERAKKSLGVEAYRPTNPGAWLWLLTPHRQVEPSAPNTKQLGDLGGVPENTGFLPFSGSRKGHTAKLNLLGGVMAGDAESDAANDAFIAAVAEDAETWGYA